MKKLNREEPFATCHGTDPKGRRYLQDGVYFNVKGEEVNDDSPDVEADQLALAAATAEAQAKAE
ncbi:MAG: hypothetical protein ACRDAM_04205, partial [Casimicrobium sp.]